MSRWSEVEDIGNLSMPPVDTGLTKRVHRPVSLSLILTPVPLLVKGVLGNIKDEEEYLVWLAGGRDKKEIFSPQLQGFGAQVLPGVRMECKLISVLGLRLEIMSLVKGRSEVLASSVRSGWSPG